MSIDPSAKIAAFAVGIDLETPVRVEGDLAFAPLEAAGGNQPRPERARVCSRSGQEVRLRGGERARMIS